MRRVLAALLLSPMPAACQSPASPGGGDGVLPPAAPVSLFGYDTTQPLDLQATPTASQNPTYQSYTVSYASPAGGRVTGVMVVPKSPGPHSGIVLMHGLPGTAAGAINHQGYEYATLGAVVLAIDAPWTRRGGTPDITPRDSADQVQLMQDLRRAVDVLVARPDVDPARIGYQGGSYGGAMGALFVGIEPRLRTAILFVPDGGLVAHFTESDGTPRGGLASAPTRDAWLAAMTPIEPIRFIARAGSLPLLIQNGRQDQLVSVEDAEALQHAAAPAGRVAPRLAPAGPRVPPGRSRCLGPAAGVA
jgi:hypothetical protein